MVKFLITNEYWEESLNGFFLETLNHVPENFIFPYDLWIKQKAYMYFLLEDEMLLLKLIEKDNFKYKILSDKTYEKMKNILIDINNLCNSNLYSFELYNSIDVCLNSLEKVKNNIPFYECSNVFNHSEQAIVEYKNIQSMINSNITTHSYMFNNLYDILDKEEISKENYSNGKIDI